MKTADRSGVQRAVIWAALAAVLTFVGSWLHASWSRTAAADALLAVADQAAAAVDPARHAALPRATEARGPALESVRHDLRMVADQHRLGSPPVTLRRLDEQSAVYVVLTHTSPSFNDVVPIRPEMRPVFAGEVPHAVSDLHTDAQGTWMSAYAAIKRPDGSVDGLVRIDRDSADLALEQRRAIWLAAIAALIGAVLGGALPVLRDLFQLRGLTGRIAFSGAFSVLVALGVASALTWRDAGTRTVSNLQTLLLTTVRLTVDRIDPQMHAAVAASGDAASPEFIALRDALRRAQEAARLTSPMYTLRRDGDRTRFVVMTNEQPFIGDEYELRPGVKATFEGAGAGAEGPYEDAHGAWISAWAPIFDARGEVIAVVQADYSLEALLMARTNQALGLLFFGLVGVAVALFAALLLAQGIARPILAVVDAARRLGGGDFEVRVHESGATEVRALSEAINQMANGLAERERIRSLFGRYVAGQVADHLLTTSHIEFAGEQRLVTVMISDIRGFTALTEALGAREIVALLNEYFSLLVDEVVRLEGVIDKFMGDAMLSWFGAPQPQPDHDQRTVDAAAAIMRRLDRWNADRAAQSLPPVPTGIGIARGEVVVGNIGSPQRLEYTAIGDAVNLASRLCSQAKAGEVLISDEVRRAVEAPTEDVGFIEVKGVAEPVHVHRLRWRQE